MTDDTKRLLARRVGESLRFIAWVALALGLVYVARVVLGPLVFQRVVLLATPALLALLGVWVGSRIGGGSRFMPAPQNITPSDLRDMFGEFLPGDLEDNQSGSDGVPGEDE